MDRLLEKIGIPVFHLGSLVDWMLSRDLAVRGETQWEAIPWMQGCQWSIHYFTVSVMPPGSPEGARATLTATRSPPSS
jgi:hypothetical protein